MELTSSYKEKVEHQFDTLVKTVLTGEVKNAKAEIAKRERREITFSALGDWFVDSLCTYDEHESDYFSFEVNGYDIIIKDDLLGEAVNSLSEKKRNIILMSYFLDMTDKQIGELLNLLRSTVTYQRHSALEMLKKFMEEMTDDEGK